MRIDELIQTLVVNTDFAPVSPPALGPGYKATLAQIVSAGLYQPNSSTAGAGANLTIKAADGVTSGAGGSIILQPGAQATTGGNGVVIVRQPGGTAGTDEGQIYHDGTDLYIVNKEGGSVSNSVRLQTNAGYGIYTSNRGTGSFSYLDSTSGQLFIAYQSSVNLSYWNVNGSTGAFNTFSDAYRLYWPGSGLLSNAGAILSVTGGSSSGTSNGGSLAYTASTPTALSANTDNLVLTGSAFQRLSASAAYNLTGIAPPSGGSHVDGRVIWLHNVGSFNITLKHSATSTAANQFITETSGDLVLGPNRIVQCTYDGTSAKWRAHGETYPYIFPTADGTNGQVLVTNGSGTLSWSTNGNASASGTTNYVAKFTGTTSLGDGIIFDNGTHVGIGTTTLNQIGGSRTLSINSNLDAGIELNANNTVYGVVYANTNGLGLSGFGAFGMRFYTASAIAGSAERMRIDASGNVGIGTASPSYRLHVSGQTYLANGSSNPLYIEQTVADGTTRDSIYLYEASAQGTGRQAISWYNGNTGYYKARIYTEVGPGYNATKFYIDTADNARTVATRLCISNGNIGINTTSPDAPLHILNKEELRIETTTATQAARLRLINNSGGNWFVGAGAWDGTSNFQIVQSGSATAGINITTAGNVGIGNTGPGAKLQVDTGAAATKGLIVKGFTSQSATLQEWQNSSGTALSYVTSAGDIFTTTNFIHYGSGSSTGLILRRSSDNATMGSFTWVSGSAEATLYSLAFMNIDASVNAGIRMGWWSTWADSVTAQVMWYKNSSIIYGSNALGVLSRVAYNTSAFQITAGSYNTIPAPTSRFEVYGDSQFLSQSTSAKTIVVKAASSQTANLTEWQNSSSNVLGSVSPTGSISSKFFEVKNQFVGQSGQPTITFTGAGNVPIALKVLDDSFGTLSFEGSAGQLFSINNNLASGVIFAVNDISGIPQIDVNADGTIRLAPFASNINVSGLTVGRGAGNVSSNTAFGSNALAANTTGNQNTAIGFEAAAQTTTGGDIVAIGWRALKNPTAATSSTAVGSNALAAVTTATDNTAVGRYAGYQLTTGGANSILGAAMYTATTAYYNVAVGHFSLHTLLTGHRNVSVGYFAGYNVTGSYNAIFGAEGGSGVTNGSYNTVVGALALPGANGSNNTVIGSFAAQFQADGSTSLTSTSNSVYVGYQTRGFSNSDSNSIVIGYQAIGKGANTTVLGNTSATQAWIYGTGIIYNSGGNNYSENLRLPESSLGWSVIHMGGAAATSGTGANQWTILKADSASSHRFEIRHSSTAVVSILTDGSVGIGTTSQTSKFQVNNSGSTNSPFYVDAGNPAGTTTLFAHTGANTPVPFRLTKSGAAGSGSYGLLDLFYDTNTAGHGSNLYFSLDDSAGNITEYGGIGARINANTNGSERGDLYFYTMNTGTGRAEQMVLRYDGNLGIGTTNPTAKLQVNQATAGTIGLQVSMPTGAETTQAGIRVFGYSPAIELMDKDSVQNWYMGIDDNDSNKLLFGRGYGPGQGVTQAMTIDVNDNVGIGTTAPGNRLHVDGGANLPIRTVSSTFSGMECHITNGTWKAFIGTESGGGGNRYNSADNQHTFYNNSTAVMRINSSGYVGIGTTGPTKSLTIAQNGSAPGVLIYKSPDGTLNASQLTAALGSGSSFTNSGTSGGNEYGICALYHNGTTRVQLYAYDVGVGNSTNFALDAFTFGAVTSFAQVGVVAKSASTPVIISRGFTSQTAPLMTYQDSSANALGYIAANGLDSSTFNDYTWTPNYAGGVNSPSTATYRKSSGNSNVWDGHVYSSEGFAKNVHVTFKVSQTNAYLMVGLNSDPATDANYSSLDYAWYPRNDGILEIYESNVSIGTFGAYTTSTVLTVAYDGTNVIYLKDGTIMRTVARAVGNLLYLDSSFYTLNGAVNSVRFGQIGTDIAASARIITTQNSASALSTYNVAKTVIGGLHFNNGAGANGSSRNEAAITFQGQNANEAQAGIYVLNDNSNGTLMGFATTDSYATGPQLGMTISNTGVINFPRAVPTYAGTALVAGTGTTNYITKWSGTNSVGNSSIFDSGAAIGFNTASPATSNGNVSYNINVSGTQNTNLAFTCTSAGFSGILEWRDTTRASPRHAQLQAGAGVFSFYTAPDASSAVVERVTITAAGLVGINDTAPGAQLEVNTAAAATKGFIIKGFTSQSANLQEWQNSGGTVMSSIDSSGRGFFNGVYLGNYGSGQAEVSGASSLYFRAPYITHYGAGPYFQWDDLGVIPIIIRSRPSAGVAYLTITGNSNSNDRTYIRLQATASQTTNLQEWQNSAGSVIASVSAGGNIAGAAISGSSLSGSSTTYGGSLLTDYWRVKSFYRAAPTTVGNYIEVCGIQEGTGYYEVAVSSEFGAGIGTTTKTYNFCMAYDTFSGFGWYGGGTLTPTNMTRQNSYTTSFDFEMELHKVTAYDIRLRLRRTAGTSARYVTITVKQHYLSTADITALSGTGTSSYGGFGQAFYIAPVNYALPVPGASGAGNNIGFYAGSGEGTGAGGSIILQPGAQATSGGNGTVIVRQPGGTAGTDEIQFSHDGTQGTIRCFDGQLQLISADNIRFHRNGDLTNAICAVYSTSGTGGFVAGYNGIVGITSSAPSGTSSGMNIMMYSDSLYISSTGSIKFGPNVHGSSQDVALVRGSVGTIRVSNNSTGGGSLAFASSTTNISTATNDLALSGSAFQRLNCTTACNLTGVAPPAGGAHVDGRILRIVNTGTANLTLVHNSASSATANRFFNVAGANLVIAPNDYAELMYDATDNGRATSSPGWRVY